MAGDIVHLEKENQGREAGDAGSNGKTDGGVWRCAGKLQALETENRWTGGGAFDGCERRCGATARLQAETQFLRPRRSHRTARCAAEDPIRASGSGMCGDFERKRKNVLRWREHLHAWAIVARLESEFLQVHE